MPGQPPARRPISKRLASNEQPAAEADILALQRGRFITWQPSPVLCGAVTGDGSVAAVGREDGQIELWDTLSWQLLKVLACHYAHNCSPIYGRRNMEFAHIHYRKIQIISMHAD
jgi:hypothetical protein